MSVSKPRESFLGIGRAGSSERLTLHKVGDQNGNAFPISSSSSSSSSSFCLGESSPESLRSISSLSGGRTDSPLDYDMLEVTLMTTVVTEMKKVTGVISKWASEEDDKQDDSEDKSVGKLQMITELSESNDNSVSVYLDANSGIYRHDTWDDNDNLTQALSVTQNSNNDELSSGRGRRHGSTTSDSDATEIPADDDNDEEEALFLSLSSDMGIQSSISQSSDGLVLLGDSAVPDDRPEITCPLDLPLDYQTQPPTSPEKAERCALDSKPTLPHSSHPARAAKTKLTTATLAITKTVAPTGFKSTSLESKRVPCVDLKNVKAKDGSRPTSSPSRTLSQHNKPAPAAGKKVVPRKQDVKTGDGGRGQRPSASPIKVVVVLKPIRGKGNNIKIQHKATASDSAQPPINRTHSTSTSSLGSEMVEEGSLDTPTKSVQEVLDECKPAKFVETAHPIEDAGKESEEDQGIVAPETLKTDVIVKKRSHCRKVSSKLGPSARLQGKGTRVDKASGSALPPGSSSDLHTPGNPEPRKAQSDGSVLEKNGQNASAGSPMKAKQTQSHSQGIPKPRTSADRASALTDLAPTTSTSKPTAIQQPGLGLPGRPALPAASKLPVKGLLISPNSSALGSNENTGATSKASPASAGAPAPTGNKPDERSSRSILLAGSHGATKSSSSSIPATSSDAVTGITAAPKPLAMRSRALSLQARTTATGLKTPTPANHNTAKMTAASQTPSKTAPAASQGLLKQQSHYPLQRSGSARLSRLNSAVDKNKPREAPGRHASSSSYAAVPARGIDQTQQQPPPDLVADVVNLNTPVAPGSPVLVKENSTTGSGTAGASGHGFKARTSSRSSPKAGSHIHGACRAGGSGPVVVDGTVTAKQNQSKEQAEKKNQAINQLRKLLIQGNRRVEALATVIQHLFTEREETLKQKKELSLELENLRAELVSSSQCYERLQKEKEEVRVSFSEALRRLEEQHKEELVQLEHRLRSFYQTEWDKVHQTYQEEADKCRMLMEQQVEELRSRQEAERKNQEVSHSQKIESLKQEYEASIQELKLIHQTDRENLEKTLKETETSLSERISELSEEKEALNEKLQAEEERRKRILSDKNLKDSHTLYLEQELESLKVVLEIKTNQLHQKEKKLMEMDKLVETNVKLEECLKKVQQENEDYKARMDKHAALSKQLSSEQAKLQQTLQKESKVNKRLSMENEELLWKLHNGDLIASPRRLSPTSPFTSPRNSASFPTAAPLSPR
ncbi:microtubule-associated tumor suppressor 1 homolog isoform X2 [Channa argus]|uniref:microtubule-associated tumor suppressor 1 homolog isoform X2 n=1 Tax=Channa argus TaxID=215402 RepID=UPI002944ECBB|nr:hypothetical protein Q8A73_003885 [Channa argus]